MQTRDFVAIEDIINSIHNAIEYTENGIFNIASGEKITIKSLAQLMILLSNKKLNIEYLKSKKGDIKYSETDIQLAKNHLNYFSKIELKDGIKKLI